MYGKERVYKKVEIIGVSSKSIEAAIETAITKAQSSLDKLSSSKWGIFAATSARTAGWPNTRW